MVDVWLQDDLKAATQVKFQGGNHVFSAQNSSKLVLIMSTLAGHG
jgi:hypothetical protein